MLWFKNKKRCLSCGKELCEPICMGKGDTLSLNGRIVYTAMKPANVTVCKNCGYLYCNYGEEEIGDKCHA